MLQIALILLLSYLVGSVPTGLVVGKVAGGMDIRKHGSGNPGVTNVFRLLGWKPAVVVAAVDIFKGYAAARYLGSLAEPGSDLVPVLAGSAAVLGHTYTVFAGFRGGKGVAALTGMVIALYPLAVPFCFLVFALAILTTGYVSVASIGAGIAFPVVVFGLPGLGFQTAGIALKVFSVIIPLFVLFTHRTNIRRLVSGTENRFEKAMIFRRARNEANDPG
ncbi:MAG: glycerol-3-phosphate 1-O-acyltransferase PlsY [Fidelibacterota bacterium]